MPESFEFIKNKSCEEEGSLKPRILFCFYRHQMKGFGKKVGRCLNIMIKHASSLFPTIAINKTTALMKWVQNTNTHIAQHYQHTPTTGKPHARFELWRLDVLEMFPRLPCECNPHDECKQNQLSGVWDTVQQLHMLYKESARLQTTPDGIHFALHVHRALNLMCQAYGPGYECITWSSILPYLHFEIFYNDQFVISNKLDKQKQGMPIGGTCSAQLASILCLMKEHAFLTKSRDSTPWFPTARAYVHVGLTLSPFRYVDKIMGVRHGCTSLKKIQQLFQKLLGVQLQIEGEGQRWTSLNATLSFSPDTGLISVAMKNCLSLQEPAHKRVVGYLHVHSPNATKVLESITPLLVLDSYHCATNIAEADANLSQVLK